jgi:hypothetical protein
LTTNPSGNLSTGLASPSGLQVVRLSPHSRVALSDGSARPLVALRGRDQGSLFENSNPQRYF